MRRVSSLSSAVSTVPEEPVLNTPAPPQPPPTPSRRAPRPRTNYYLAQPPPGRARHCASDRALILQVQKGSATSRPRPVLDVLPSSVFGSKLKRVGQFLHGTGQQDMVFVTSEQYVQEKEEGDSSEDDEDLHSRHVVASVSQAIRRNNSDDSKGTRTTVIRFDGGLVWEASPLVSGGYEFVAHEQDGTMRVAKWLPKPPPASRRKSYQSAQQRSVSPTTSEPEERRFQFSILDNMTRRRPIIASMGHQSIDILDRHPGNTITSASNTPTNTPPSSVMDVDMSTEDGYNSAQYSEISEHLKEIIVVTGTWVALREGLASNSRTEDISTMAPPAAPTFRPTSRSVGSGDEVHRRMHRQNMLMTNSGKPDNEVRPRRSKSAGSADSNLNRISRTFGRGAPPGIPEVEPVLEAEAPPQQSPQLPLQSIKPVPADPIRQRAVSVPPPPPPSEDPTQRRRTSRSFPGRSRHSNTVHISATSSRISGQYDGIGSARPESPVESKKGPEKRGRFGLRAMMSNVFKCPSV